MRHYVKALNAFYKGNPALYQIEDDWSGFAWLNVDNANQSSLSFLRRARTDRRNCVCAFNFTPVTVERFVIGLPSPGKLQGVFTSDDVIFGGAGRCHNEAVAALPEEFAGHPFRAVIDLPPLTALYFDFDEEETKD
jgi:1,4-alpha-glucan branching enzyme